MIKLHNLRKKFGDKTILNSIDLSVNKGETVAIIDPSGSGKSTTLRCINLLERPDSGELTIGDTTYDLKNISNKDVLDIRRNVNLTRYIIFLLFCFRSYI